MKIGIVGAGHVGATAAFALVQHQNASEIVLVDSNRALAAAQCQDILHSTPLASPCRVTHGDYPDLAGSGVVILAAGVNQQPGESRLGLLNRNGAVFAQIVPQVLRHCHPIFLVATNPVDIMTWITTRIAGDAHAVIGSGTILDSARFRALLGAHLDVSVHSVHAHVIGEHGDSEVLCWSSAAIGGIPVSLVAERLGRPITAEIRQEIDQGVRNAAYSIIAGKGATWFGIAAGLSRIVQAIAADERALFTVSACPAGDAAGPALSLPRLVGATGVLQTLEPSLDGDEQQRLAASRQILAEVVAQLRW